MSAENRLLVSYPPVAFVQVLAHVVNSDRSSSSSPTDDEDLNLLHSFAQDLQAFAGLGGHANSHVSRLSAFAKILADFAAEFKCSVTPRGVEATKEPAKRPGSASWAENCSGSWSSALHCSFFVGEGF